MAREGRSREALLLVGAQAAGQVALLVVIPLLTRVYSPGELGLYQVALSIALVAQPLATLRLEFLVPVQGSDAAATRQYRVGTAVLTGLSVAVTLVGAALLAWADGDLGPAAVMVGLLLFVNGWTVLDNARLIRRRQQRRLAVRNLLAGLLAAGLQLVVALLDLPVTWLAVALFVGRTLAIVATRGGTTGDGATGGGATKGGATGATDPVERRREQPYGVRRASVAVAAGTVANLSVYGLPLLVGATHGYAASGQVGTAQRVTNTPVSLSGQALGQLAQLRTSEIVRTRRPELAHAVHTLVSRTALVALPLALVLVVAGPFLAVPVLGPGWEGAGTVIALLGVPTALQLCVAPAMPVLVMLGREGVLLRLQVGRVVLGLVGGLVPFALGGGYLHVCAGFAAATVLAYVLTAAVTTREAGRFDRACRDEV